MLNVVDAIVWGGMGLMVVAHLTDESWRICHATIQSKKDKE